MNTVGQLSQSIRAQIWASHEAEQLIDPHKLLVIEALANIQNNVPCEQVNNANTVLFCNTFFKCGTTITEAPRGVIKRVYTIEDDDWCCPVYYRQATFQDVQNFRLWDRDYENPANAGQPKFPLGFLKAEATTDADAGRAYCGIYAIHQGNLHLAPWIQSTEKLIIEWDGLKDAGAWKEEDPVSDAVMFRNAVKLFVQFAHERDYGDPQQAVLFKNPARTGHYDEALSDLMLRCREETRIRNNEEYEFCGPWVWSALELAGITGGPTTTEQEVFGGVGSPEGIVDGPQYAIYNEVTSAGDYYRTWIKTTPAGTLTGWQ